MYPRLTLKGVTQVKGDCMTSPMERPHTSGRQGRCDLGSTLTSVFLLALFGARSCNPCAF